MFGKASEPLKETRTRSISAFAAYFRWYFKRLQKPDQGVYSQVLAEQ